MKAVSDNVMKNVIKNIMAEEGTVWAYTEDQAIHGFVITTPRIDNLTETGSILIYAAYSFGGMTEEMMVDALETLKEYTRSCGFEELVAYSSNKPLIRFLAQNGATVDRCIVTIPA